MALPPTIPTSFVPKQPVETGGKRAREGTNLFMIIGLILIGVSVLAAGITFGYQKYLENVRNAKSSQLAEKIKDIDQSTVEGFIRLQNRLISANTLLDRHVVLSNFFDVLENLTIQNVRFSALNLTVGDDRTTQIQMAGTAKTFNALAAESAGFAKEPRIRRAIFSQIKVNTNGTVAFSVTAEIDPHLIMDTASAAEAAQPETPVQTPLETEQTAPAASTTASTTGL